MKKVIVLGCVGSIVITVIMMTWLSLDEEDPDVIRARNQARWAAAKEQFEREGHTGKWPTVQPVPTSRSTSTSNANVSRLSALAKKGDLQAMKMMANCWEHGIGTSPDPYAAIGWLTKAANAGDGQAMLRLAEYYEEGIWIQANPEKAAQLRKNAAEKGVDHE